MRLTVPALMAARKSSRLANVNVPPSAIWSISLEVRRHREQQSLKRAEWGISFDPAMQLRKLTSISANTSLSSSDNLIWCEQSSADQSELKSTRGLPSAEADAGDVAPKHHRK